MMVGGAEGDTTTTDPEESELGSISEPVRSMATGSGLLVMEDVSRAGNGPVDARCEISVVSPLNDEDRPLS